MRHIPAIDGLRAVAVLAVVAYHAGLPVPAGFVGVDVFFVISGYIITTLLLREDRIDLVEFYGRRARRLLPALTVVVVATLFAGALLLSPAGPLQALFKSAAASMLFAGNIHFQGLGYFDGSSEEFPLLHLWSLGVEEQFYLVWPVLLIGLRRSRHRRLIMAALWVASFGLCEWLRQAHPNAAFYQMPARFWELATGCLIAMSPPVRSGKWFAWAGMALVAASIFWLPPGFPGVGALPAVAGAGLIVLGIRSGYQPDVLCARPMVFIGAISYSLYLWHWPLLAMEKAWRIGETPLWVRLALVAAALVLAWMTHRDVEVPWRHKQVTARASVVRGLATSGVLALAALGGISLASTGMAHSRLAHATAMDKPSMMDRCHDGVNAPVTPLPRAGCAEAKPKVAIWGDSHALAWQPFAAAIGPAASLTRNSCPPALGYRSEACQAFNAAALEYLKGAGTVVVTGHWLSYGESIEAPLASTIRRLSASVDRVVIIGPTPWLPESAPVCIEAQRLDACAVKRADFESKSARSRAFLASLAGGNVEYIDPTNFFCGDTLCPVLKDGYALYWDDDHISATAAKRFAETYRR